MQGFAEKYKAERGKEIGVNIGQNPDKNHTKIGAFITRLSKSESYFSILGKNGHSQPKSDVRKICSKAKYNSCTGYMD